MMGYYERLYNLLKQNIKDREEINRNTRILELRKLEKTLRDHVQAIDDAGGNCRTCVLCEDKNASPYCAAKELANTIHAELAKIDKIRLEKEGKR